MTKRTKTQLAQDERDAARETLRDMLPAGATVYVIQRHVSQSGMSRRLSLLAIVSGELRDITVPAGRAMGDSVRDWHGHRTLMVNGCGMDMHYATVYGLSTALYGWEDGAGYLLRHHTI